MYSAKQLPFFRQKYKELVPASRILIFDGSIFDKNNILGLLTVSLINEAV